MLKQLRAAFSFVCEQRGGHHPIRLQQSGSLSNQVHLFHGAGRRFFRVRVHLRGWCEGSLPRGQVPAERLQIVPGRSGGVLHQVPEGGGFRRRQAAQGGRGEEGAAGGGEKVVAEEIGVEHVLRNKVSSEEPQFEQVSRKQLNQL